LQCVIFSVGCTTRVGRRKGHTETSRKRRVKTGALTLDDDARGAMGNKNCVPELFGGKTDTGSDANDRPREPKDAETIASPSTSSRPRRRACDDS